MKKQPQAKYSLHMVGTNECLKIKMTMSCQETKPKSSYCFLPYHVYSSKNMLAWHTLKNGSVTETMGSHSKDEQN